MSLYKSSSIQLQNLQYHRRTETKDGMSGITPRLWQVGEGDGLGAKLRKPKNGRFFGMCEKKAIIRLIE